MASNANDIASWNLPEGMIGHEYFDPSEFEQLLASFPQSQSPSSSVEVPMPDIPTDARQWMVTDTTSQRLRAPRLFEFLLLLLQRPQYDSYASYTDRSKGIFQIHQPDRVAALWQQIKSRQSAQDMTYDKFARAIRWYYNQGIMVKTNTRYTFQFSENILQASLTDANNNIRTSGFEMD